MFRLLEDSICMTSSSTHACLRACLVLAMVTGCGPDSRYRFVFESGYQPISFQYSTWFLGFDDYEPMRESPTSEDGSSLMALADESGITDISVFAITLRGPFDSVGSTTAEGPALVSPIALSWRVSDLGTSCVDGGRELARIDLPAGTPRVAWPDTSDGGELLDEASADDLDAVEPWLLADRAFSACLTTAETPSGGAYDYGMTFAWTVTMAVAGEGHPCDEEGAICAP